MINYGFTKELNVQFEAALELVSEALKKAGLGILTIIDLKEKFKEKLGIDFKKYVILGTCHPPNAYKSILVEENIGLMLPCNVLLYEKDKRTVLSIIKPTLAMQMINNEDLESIAEEIEEKLKNVFDSIQG